MLSMISRIMGTLEAIEGFTATIAPTGIAGLAYEVMLPAFLADRLRGNVGQGITLVTFHYLEGQAQGSSFEPRLIGFANVRERAFFDLFTTVKGIGNKKALRAMAVEPATIAAAIASKDAKSLTKLPEIGKRLAETIIAELSGKVESYLGDADVAAFHGSIESKPTAKRTPAVEEAISVLVTLGESPVEAERRVGLALARAEQAGVVPKSADEIVELLYARG